MFKLRIILTLIISTVLLSLPFNALGAVSASIPVDIKVNDVYIKTDADAFLIGDTTFVPIRFVSEALGADSVKWNGANRSATITAGNTVITLPVGKKYAFVNGEKVYLDESVRIISDRTFVPVRFVAENLNATVKWNSIYYIVNIYKSSIQIDNSLIDKAHYGTDEVLWLARIIEAESSGEPMEGKIAVGNVILNRVKSPDFPNTIYGVIFDDGQFTPVQNGTINNNPSDDSIIAAKKALNGENYAGNSMFFLNPVIAQSNWIGNNRPFYVRIDNHDFYL